MVVTVLVLLTSLEQGNWLSDHARDSVEHQSGALIENEGRLSIFCGLPEDLASDDKHGVLYDGHPEKFKLGQDFAGYNGVCGANTV